MFEENKALINRFYEEVVNQRNMVVADEIVAADFDDHAAQGSGIEGFRKLFSIIISVFPDLHVIVEDLIAEDDKVAARVELTATQAGSFRGFPPSNWEVTFSVMDIFRFTEGNIVERWMQRDFPGMLERLGDITR